MTARALYHYILGHCWKFDAAAPKSATTPASTPYAPCFRCISISKCVLIRSAPFCVQEGTFGDDWLTMCCCPSCALCQELNELDHAREHGAERATAFILSPPQQAVMIATPPEQYYAMPAVPVQPQAYYTPQQQAQGAPQYYAPPPQYTQQPPPPYYAQQQPGTAVPVPPPKY